MTIITVALLIVVVCSSELDPPAPKYSNAKYLYYEAVRKASSIIAQEPSIELKTPNARQNYVFFLAALNDMSFNLSRSCGGDGDLYNDNYYDILDDMIPRAWKNPEEYIHKLKQLVAVSMNITAPIVDVIEQYCAPVRFKDDLDCDTVVDLTVKFEPEKYERAAKTLLALAEVSKVYLENLRVDEANKNGMIQFLLKCRDVLRPLIEALTTVREYLDPPTLLQC